MEWNGKPYRSLDFEMKKRFGTKVYKISLDGGMTCPNRDGTLGTRGCIFCSEGGSGDFAAQMRLTGGSAAERSMSRGESNMEDSGVSDRTTPYSTSFSNRITPYSTNLPDDRTIRASVTSQIEEAAARIAKKLGDAPAAYIAYFQSYTNTYAPVSYLRTLFTAAIEHPDVKVLSVATRPDCVSDEILDLCAELNRIKPVWLELGLQTIHDRTARSIRRGYDLAVFEDALRRIRSRRLETIVHLILGLPGETREDMLETVRYVGRQDVQGVKLQLLHVLKGTDLADLYQHNPFPILTPDEYLDLILDTVALLPPEITIHRLTGDGPRSLLIAPTWSTDKKRVLNTLTRKFRETGITQGCRRQCPT